MAEAVRQLKALGFTILMDDFGSGYSSLNMLKDITVDILKIDMGFLARQDQSQRSESILERLVELDQKACAMVDAFLNNSFVKGAAPERAAFLTSLFDGVLKVEAENFK